MFHRGKEVDTLHRRLAVAGSEKDELASRLAAVEEQLSSYTEWANSLRQERDSLEREVQRMRASATDSGNRAVQQYTELWNEYQQRVRDMEALQAETNRLRGLTRTLAAMKLRDLSYAIKNQACVLALAPAGIETVKKDLEYTQGLREQEAKRNQEAQEALLQELKEAQAANKELHQILEVAKEQDSALKQVVVEKEQASDYWRNQYQSIVKAVDTSDHDKTTIVPNDVRVLQNVLANNEALGRAGKSRALALRRIEKKKFQQQLANKDNEIVQLQLKLSDAARKIDMVNLQSELKQVQIDQEIPGLQRRVEELEAVLVKPNASTSSSNPNYNLCERLKIDLRRAKAERDDYWNQANQGVVNAALERLDNEQFALGVRVDLEAAAGYLEERHKLRAENEALKDRFSSELLAKPLRVPSLKKGEEDAAEEADMKKKVEAHFGFTYGIKPRSKANTGLEAWEQI